MSTVSTVEDKNTNILLSSNVNLNTNMNNANGNNSNPIHLQYLADEKNSRRNKAEEANVGNDSNDLDSLGDETDSSDSLKSRICVNNVTDVKTDDEICQIISPLSFFTNCTVNVFGHRANNNNNNNAFNRGKYGDEVKLGDGQYAIEKTLPLSRGTKSNVSMAEKESQESSVNSRSLNLPAMFDSRDYYSTAKIVSCILKQSKYLKDRSRATRETLIAVDVAKDLVLIILGMLEHQYSYPMRKEAETEEDYAKRVTKFVETKASWETNWIKKFSRDIEFEQKIEENLHDEAGIEGAEGATGEENYENYEENMQIEVKEVPPVINIPIEVQEVPNQVPDHLGYLGTYFVSTYILVGYAKYLTSDLSVAMAVTDVIIVLCALHVTWKWIKINPRPTLDKWFVLKFAFICYPAISILGHISLHNFQLFSMAILIMIFSMLLFLLLEPRTSYFNKELTRAKTNLFFILLLISHILLLGFFCKMDQDYGTFKGFGWNCGKIGFLYVNLVISARCTMSKYYTVITESNAMSNWVKGLLNWFALKFN